jgi:hypothetical protein
MEILQKREVSTIQQSGRIPLSLYKDPPDKTLKLEEL